ncbi:hypothetical protein [Embleya sp. NPDC020886]|uniref:hypothetical protein n=1 Tax=Embleya sp. NPDC020886 TaxID=3363980 RepID=UPI0037BB9EEE
MDTTGRDTDRARWDRAMHHARDLVAWHQEHTLGIDAQAWLRIVYERPAAELDRARDRTAVALVPACAARDHGVAVDDLLVGDTIGYWIWPPGHAGRLLAEALLLSDAKTSVVLATGKCQ